MLYVMTNLTKPQNYARKARRVYPAVKQSGNTVVVWANQRPWAELAGHMTISTSVFQAEGNEYDIDEVAKENRS